MPGPPRFTQSTILVISSPDYVKLALKKFGIAIKITATKETVPVVSRVSFLAGCMINWRKPKTAASASIATLFQSLHLN